MIIVNLIGGLGNQMFQYAFGRALSIELNEPVRYDVRQLLARPAGASYTFRDYELDVFRAPVEFATNNDLRLFGLAPVSQPSRTFYKVYRRLVRAHQFREKKYFGYEEAALRSGAYTYYDGYWQNERYFKPYEQIIRQELELKKPLTNRNLEVANQIKAVPVAVSLHVRRGDYVSNTDASQAHGVCSPAYYEQAVKLLQERFNNIQLFAFSDEPAWVRANMRFEVPVTYVSHNTGKASVEDIRLMSLCQHNIIANSSFSWWGAWLNANPNKLVIAPKPWMQLHNEVANGNGPVPAEWISL